MQLRLILMADVVREVVLHEVTKAGNRIPYCITTLVYRLLRRVKSDLFRLDGPARSDAASSLSWASNSFLFRLTFFLRVTGLLRHSLCC
ncbi:Uncharacterised protein [Klebsiella pneumoniae]|uniref:Uncharacterized protein n=1 Tax=Klebsiella pneumoniae TaxID=573 RepID=A0A2X3IPG4_KLEPN|nr:Uncharacterised protein [Klebsiella pneumoniae]